MGDNTVISRVPYISGNSDVITVTGIPGVNIGDTMYIKEVDIKGVTATVMVRYDEMSELDLERMSDKLVPVEE